MDPEFREDGVREEIVAPLIRALGYGATGPCRVVRGRRLVHPYLSAGSQRRKLNLIPDYLLLIDDQVLCVIEAKSPSESIVDPDHLAQTYGYAVHHEIQAPAYALCNGHELAVHHVGSAGRGPVLSLRLCELAGAWDRLVATLGPFELSALDARKLPLDYGLHLRACQFPVGFALIMLDVRFASVARVGPDEFTLMTTVEDEREFAASFDFERSLLQQLPPPLRQAVASHLNRVPAMIRFEEQAIGIASTITDVVLDNHGREYYSPLRVTRFFRAVGR